MKKFLFIAVLAVFSAGLTVSAQEAKRFRYGANVGVGYSTMDNDFSTMGFSYAAGAEVSYDFGFIGMASGVSFKRLQHRLTSELGGLTGSSDFIEKYKYNLSYLEVPLLVRLNIWADSPAFVGVGANFCLGGRKDYKRIGTGLSGVDDASVSDITNLEPAVFSLKFGWDVMFSKSSGIRFEIDAPFTQIYTSRKSKISSLMASYLLRF